MMLDRKNESLAVRTEARKRTRFSLALCLLGASATIIASPLAKNKADRPSAARRWFQVGKASWYGQQFQGRKTANGEKFDMNALTCAHRSLPLGTWLRVTNLVNHRSTFVRVNDRGPIVANRILDLSFAAAQKLALSGISKVKIEPVVTSDPNMATALVAELITDRSTTLADR